MTKKPRPYWHVDAKWVSGLLLLAALTANLVVLATWQMLAPTPAVTILSWGLAMTVSPLRMDDPANYQDYVIEARNAPGGEKRIVPGLTITISAAELEKLSPREGILFMMSKLAKILYDQGPSGLAEKADTADPQATLLYRNPLFQLITYQSYASLLVPLLVLTGLSLLLFVPLILFSYKAGRLTSPGIVLILAGLPGVVLSVILMTAAPMMAAAIPPRAASYFELAVYAGGNLLTALGVRILVDYAIVSLVGLVLFSLGVLVGIVSWLRRGNLPADNQA